MRNYFFQRVGDMRSFMNFFRNRLLKAIKEGIDISSGPQCVPNEVQTPNTWWS